MALSTGYGRLLRLPGVPRMAGAGLVLGIAGTVAPVSFVLSGAGAALGGQLVAADGPRAAIVAACAATAVAWLVTTLRAGTLSGSTGQP